MSNSLKFNFPSLKRAEIAPALIEQVVPLLADAIRDAAAEMAERECGESATIFDVERIAGDMLFALADLLTLSPIPLRGVGDLLRFHQLDAIHAAAYFEVDLDYSLDAPTEDDTQEAVQIPSSAGRLSTQLTTGTPVHFNDLAAAARALNLSDAQIAELGGAVVTNVTPEKMKCALDGCNVHFTPQRANQKFHSDNCRKAYWNAERRGHRNVAQS